MVTRKHFLINGLGVLALVLAAVVAAISISGQAAARGDHNDKAEVQLRNAAGDFQTALAVNRALRLDRKAFSPKLIAFFEEVRRRR